MVMHGEFGRLDLIFRSRRGVALNPVMSETKWDELRLAMYGLGVLRPSWRTKDLSGYVSPWDGEWLYHFREGGYSSIEWVEIRVTTPEQDAAVEAVLRRVHLTGHRVEQGIRVYGYAREGAILDYI
jgi:hypothetical protein